MMSYLSSPTHDNVKFRLAFAAILNLKSGIFL